MPEREQFVQRGFDFQEAELANARLKLSEKARGGNAAAAKALKDVKEQQRSLTQRRTMAMATLRREPELIAPGHLTFLAHALIVPSVHVERRLNAQRIAENEPTSVVVFHILLQFREEPFLLHHQPH